MIATEVETSPQFEGRYGQQGEHIPIGQGPLEGHRPRDPFSEGRRLEVVLPRKSEPHQGPTQSVQQRKPPLATGSRRNLGIHARNSAVPTASGNAHSTIQATEPGSPLPDRISRKTQKTKSPSELLRKGF